MPKSVLILTGFLMIQKWTTNSKILIPEVVVHNSPLRKPPMKD